MSPALSLRPLTEQEQQALQEGLSSPIALKRRRSHILLARAQGRSSVEIAQEVGCSRHTVRNAVRAFQKRGLGCLQAQPRERGQDGQPGQDGQGRKRHNGVPHNRAIQRDHTTRPLQAPPDEEIETLLGEVVAPAAWAHMAHFRALGLRERILSLPVFVAFLLGLLWRQMGSVADAVRALQREGLLWSGPVRVSAQAAARRLQTFPSSLFQAVLMDVLPVLQERWRARQRPLGPTLTFALRHFSCVLALDGSTLDGLLRKVGLLRQEEMGVLAGRIGALLDVGSRLPRALWFEEDSLAHDRHFAQRALDALSIGALLLMDMGFTDYAYYQQFGQQGKSFITRLKKNAVFEITKTLARGPQGRDVLIRLGAVESNTHTDPLILRLVEVTWKGKLYRYLTNVLDPRVLPAHIVVSLYLHRWCIEEALLVAKRLLGLSYFLTGSQEGVQSQLWATWVLYAVLVDLTDAVAERLDVPYDAISLEMVFRGLYHYTQARQRGDTDDPVTYLARPDNRDLAVLKRDPPLRTYELPCALPDWTDLS